MKKYKCLVISWYFPPINSSEGMCTYKLLKNSSKEYDVFTQSNKLDWSYGSNAEVKMSDNINPIYYNEENIKKWADAAYQYFVKNANKYDSVMSRSNEPEAHDVAYKIKKNFPNIKWIASFGDPIAYNPYQNLYMKKSPYKVKGNDIFSFSLKYILSPKRIVKNLFWNFRNNKYLKKHTRFYKNRKTEDITIKYCDYLVFNNDYQKTFMLEKYDKQIKSKSVVIPHSYDLDLYPLKSKKTKSDRIMFSYLGHLDSDRSPIQLFKALKRLKNENYDLYNKITFNFYGKMAEKDKIYLIDNKLFDSVNIMNDISYIDSLQVMQSSDYLLLIDANLSLYINQNIFFPAKLADYIGSGKPIFGISMQEGASADIIRSSGGYVSSFSEDEIYLFLVNLISNKISIQTNKDIINKYNAKKVAKDFDKFVEFERQ